MTFYIDFFKNMKTSLYTFKDILLSKREVTLNAVAAEKDWWCYG